MLHNVIGLDRASILLIRLLWRFLICRLVSIRHKVLSAGLHRCLHVITAQPGCDASSRPVTRIFRLLNEFATLIWLFESGDVDPLVPDYVHTASARVVPRCHVLKDLRWARTLSQFIKGFKAGIVRRANEGTLLPLIKAIFRQAYVA